MQRRIAEPQLEVHLLGLVEFERCLALQRRLVYEAGGSTAPRMTLLLCEHPPVITVGRSGSRGHIRLSGHELASQRLTIRWTGRGGGCLLHVPGQLAIYPIVPLQPLGWSVGDFMRRLQQALRATLDELGVRTRTRPGHFGLWGRSGPLVACGVAVKHHVTSHGAFLNVHPPLTTMRRVDTFPPNENGHENEQENQDSNGNEEASTVRATMSCLLAERRRAARMPQVRATLVQQFSAVFGCPRYHLHTGHPLLRSRSPSRREPARRAC